LGNGGEHGCRFPHGVKSVLFEIFTLKGRVVGTAGERGLVWAGLPNFRGETPRQKSKAEWYRSIRLALKGGGPFVFRLADQNKAWSKAVLGGVSGGQHFTCFFENIGILEK